MDADSPDAVKHAYWVVRLIPQDGSIERAWATYSRLLETETAQQGQVLQSLVQRKKV